MDQSLGAIPLEYHRYTLYGHDLSSIQSTYIEPLKLKSADAVSNIIIFCVRMGGRYRKSIHVSSADMEHIPDQMRHVWIT